MTASLCSRLHSCNESKLVPHIQTEENALYALKHQNTLMLNSVCLSKCVNQSCDCLCGSMSMKYRKKRIDI